MNKQNKRIMIIAFGVLFLSVGVLLVYIILKLEVERLTKANLSLEEELTVKRNKQVSLIVEVQKLESEQRIVKIANEKLGLVKLDEPYSIAEIDEEELTALVAKVEAKYE